MPSVGTRIAAAYQQNPARTVFYGILIGSAVVLVIVAIAAGIWAATNGNGKGSTSGTKVQPTLRDPRAFFSLMSTAGDMGRDDQGNLVRNGDVVEAGIVSREDASAYLLRAPVKPRYGEDWDTAARRVAPDYFGSQSAPTQAVVIEGSGTIVRLDDVKLTAKLLVVRHGATLLICGDKPVLEVEGVLVESGGLLQCGAEGAPFAGELFDVVLRANPLGYAKCGVLASQYAYQWYCPGVTKAQPPLFTDITGSQDHFNNHFGARCFAVGFNGNLVLRGAVGAVAPVEYRGTWSARHSSDQTPWFDPEEHFLTFGDPEYRAGYALTWTHLADGSGFKGQTTIQLDPEARGEALAQWRVGARVLLTAVPRHFAEGGDKPSTLGTPMMWLDYDPEEDKANHDANKATVDAMIAAGGGVYGDEIGCEIATIAAIDRASGSVTFARPLRFHHAWNATTNQPGGAYRARITRGSTVVEVDTRPHIALLTRNIRIAAVLEDAPDSGGAFNRPSTAAREANPSDYDFRGPGGECVPDWYTVQPLNTYSDVYDVAYKYRDEGLALTDPSDPKWQAVRRSVRVGTGAPSDPAQYAKVEDIEPVGCWQLGSAGMRGANSILGAQSMFRYGSSTTVDGVELLRMGINGASGNLAQYALHYHLAGWTTEFDEYLDSGAARDATVANCAIYQCPSRVVSLHGTNLATLCNNVSFLTYGSAWFTEEGVERFNTFEHNLAVATMLLRWSDWDNPSKLIPYAAYDFNNASVFWIKNNNHNACVRNVAACCPRPVVAYWPITQQVAGAHNLASVCVGDEARKLPGIAASWCASGGPDSNKFALGITGHHAPCWAPESYYFKGYTNAQGCPAQTNDNVSPYYRFSDNIAYSLLAMVNTYISFYACMPHATGIEPCAGPSRQAFPTTLDAAPLWIPKSGLNSTTDEMVVGVYLQPQYAGSSVRSEGLFQPWSAAEETAFNGGGGASTCCPTPAACPGRSKGITADATSCSRCMPCVFSSCLSFATSPFVGQTGSAMWSKAQSSWAVNCCALTYGGGAGNIPGTSNNTASSTSFVFAVGDDIIQFPFAYMVMHNLMTDGAVDLYPVPTVFSGDKTLLADSCAWRAPEYITTAAVALPDLYFAEGIDHTAVPSQMWTTMAFTPGRQIQIYDANGSQWVVQASAGPNPWEVAANGSWTPDNTAKMPFLMEMHSGNGRLLRYTSSFSNYSSMQKFVQATPQATAIPAEYAIGMFHTPLQIHIGDTICSILAKIITPSK